MEEEGIEIYGYTDKPQVPHAALRAKERYGVDLTNEDLKKMSEICQLKKCCRDYQKPLGYGKHHILVLYKEIWWNVIYCEESKIICTILHPKHNPKARI